jgi:hypothetical protein
MSFMRLLRCPLDKKIIFLILTVILFTAGSATVIAEETNTPDKLQDARYSMLGIRLGVWIDNNQTVKNDSISADFPDASFYTEFFYDYRLTRILMAELSLGVVSRGDATFNISDDSYIGTINLYSILVQLKFSPLSGRTRSLHPFLVGGGGLVFGKHNTDVTLVTGSAWRPELVEDNETAFLGVFGGGVDIAISEQLGLTAVAKYYPIDFGDTLAEISDYSGLAISFGVAYYLHKK